MKYLKAFGLFWYHFIVGDDWRIACGVILGLIAVYGLAHNALSQVWWLLPVFVVLMLALSVWSAARRSS